MTEHLNLLLKTLLHLARLSENHWTYCTHGNVSVEFLKLYLFMKTNDSEFMVAEKIASLCLFNFLKNLSYKNAWNIDEKGITTSKMFMIREKYAPSSRTE